MGLNKLEETSWGIIAILAILGVIFYFIIRKPSGQVSSSPSYYYNLYLSGLDGSGASGGGSGASTIAPPTYAYGIGGIAQLESYYGSDKTIYYNPTTHIAQINPPARSIYSGKGAVYAD